MILPPNLELAIFAIAKCRPFVDFPCWDTNSAKYQETAIAYNNYIPFFAFRAKLDSLTREEQDAKIYELERAGKVELSNLVDPTGYTQQQIASGIKQWEWGCPLFFLMVE